ncbi:MAG: glycerophosphoryl diester phosphodiesterase membrane domain-containing protein [Actinomycetaceae bacterium]|nr:glycerophosphoryl diester phosphodiesterase membrane domain-containing protein [Actinomycetaceae bacterium]
MPIRPLNLGDILTGTFQLFRFNIKPTLAYSALVTIFINIIFLPLTVFFSAQLSSYIPENVKTNQSAGMHTLFLFSAAPTTIATALLVPALTYVTLQAVLGNKVTISETWKTIKGTVLTYISAVIILGILLSLIFVIVVVEAFAIYTTTGSDSITIITTLASLFVATIFYIFLAVRFIFTGPTVVLERRSVFAALKRSWQLTKGNEWRIFGITLLGSLLIAFVMNVVLVPLTVAFTLLPIILGTKGSSAAVITTLITSLSSIISNIVTAPWNNALTTLLYTDVRFRDEAYDLELLKQLTK